jgi:beta-xylosidase
MIITDIVKIGDPQVLLYEGKYYCYATDCNHYSQGFCVWVSDDLVNWSEEGIFCFDAIKSWGKSHFWAPEVVYHNGKFVMHYTAKSRELDSLRLGVAVSESPTGPFVDVHGKPMFDLGYATIDGSVLRCDEGNFFYYSRDCCENYVDGIKTSQLYCVRLNDDLTEVVGEHKLVSTPTEDFEKKSMALEKVRLWNEGPCVIKLGDKYVMNYSANYYASNDYAICVSTADSPMGPWVKSKNNPVLSCRKELFGAGHNAFFTGKDGEIYTSFHIQTDPAHPSGDRRTVIGKVSFSEKNGEIFEEIE